MPSKQRKTSVFTFNNKNLISLLWMLNCNTLITNCRTLVQPSLASLIHLNCLLFFVLSLWAAVSPFNFLHTFPKQLKLELLKDNYIYIFLERNSWLRWSYHSITAIFTLKGCFAYLWKKLDLISKHINAGLCLLHHGAVWASMVMWRCTLRAACSLPWA